MSYRDRGAGRDGVARGRRVIRSDGTLNTTTTECGGSKTFTPSDADGDVAATLCLTVQSTGTLLHCNNIAVPSTHNAPYIRAAGWGLVWQYVWSEGTEFVANLYLGGVGQDSIDGYDNNPQTNQRLLVPYVESAMSRICVGGCCY